MKVGFQEASIALFANGGKPCVMHNTFELKVLLDHHPTTPDICGSHIHWHSKKRKEKKARILL